MDNNKFEYETKKTNIVFFISAPIVALFVLWGFIAPGHLERVSNDALALTLNNFGWFYMLCTAFFIVFVLFLAISPFGKLRLGKPDERPEYKFYTWLGMLFSAGIGVGFVFWGVAEPALYFLDPHPDYVDAADQYKAAAGLRYAVFHWALHPWAIFSLVALTLAYVQFRKDQPALISSAFQPILGDRIYGPLGKGIDVLAVLATSTGVATTFGLSALQITGGLSHLTGTIPNNPATQLTVIAIVTVLFIFSAATGVNKGIRILSTINLTVAGLLLVFVIIFGPTLFIAESVVSTIGGYIANVTQMSLDLNPFGDGEWLGMYTIFFWAWHISWAPFMGIFIARISRGRTIREFVAGVLIVPSLLAVIWFTAFGGTALDMIMGGNDHIANLVLENVEVALFVTLNELPLGMIMSGLAVILIIIFFITSADSASYVLAALSSEGSLDPKLWVKVVWGFLIASTASVLLVSGGLSGLQTASIVAALPFAIIMVIMIFSLLMMMSRDTRAEQLWTRRKRTRKIKKEVHSEMYDRVKDNMLDDMKEDVYEEIKEEVYEQVKEEVYDDIKEEVYEEFKEKIYDDLREDLSEQLNGELEERMDDSDDKKKE
ncbi:BCCT family transporter [Evansella cellulosilytica]|uniref:Choline/carnitine/betaine transporter n=1 Tax=Evansella cellulosilytica (strain ATCC 21833 / DSM 2522 / FERM P-1141 / JCM 9156 / N-4) TaxID=649639 RepID=E6TV09_EVAC2|nr:BCCT family transporter [Evansella cellulosilytica]ADU28592.1 choline/carnitine/betaine transporter [Evansella cellulosilytica DSM 2522]